MLKKVSHFASLIPGAQLPMRYLSGCLEKVGTSSYFLSVFLADKLWAEPKI